jgi:MoxR-like ATPase
MTENQNINNVHIFHEQLKEQLHKFIVGYDNLLDLLSITLLTDGALLMEGIPGTAKTTICKIFAQNIGGKFGRLQGAVDILPMDVIGVQKYLQSQGDFSFEKGPIFSNVFLVDEINRMTPKAQGALLEALAERQVTVDNLTFPLPYPFVVIATQNPYEMEGTFNLIESQKDRFTLSYHIRYLDLGDEISILRKGMDRALYTDISEQSCEAITNLTNILTMQETVKNVYASEDILSYIGDLILATRTHNDVKLGISTRGSLSLLRSAMAYAAIHGRDYVIPDDVKFLATYCFTHRLILKREAVLGGITIERVISDILETVPVR